MSVESSIRFDLHSESATSAAHTDDDGVAFRLGSGSVSESRDSPRLLNCSAPASPSHSSLAATVKPVPVRQRKIPTAPAAHATPRSKASVTRAAAEDAILRDPPPPASTSPRQGAATAPPLSAHLLASNGVRTLSPERKRELVERGGPPTRGEHSLNPLAPDARKAPPDVQGPPRYLRSQGVTPIHSARGRGGNGPHHRASSSSSSNSSQGHKDASDPATEKTSEGRRDRRKPRSRTMRKGDAEAADAHSQDGKADALTRRHGHVAPRANNGTKPPTAAERASILAPEYTEDELTGFTDRPDRNNIDRLEAPHDSHPSPQQRLQPMQTSPSFPSSLPCRGSTARGGAAVAASASPLRQPPPRSHSSQRTSQAADGLPDTQRPALSPPRADGGASTGTTPHLPTARVNRYAQPRVVALEEAARNEADGEIKVNPAAPDVPRRLPVPRATGHDLTRKQHPRVNADASSHSNLRSPSSFLSEIRRSPTSLAYPRPHGPEKDRAPGGEDSSLPSALLSSSLASGKRVGGDATRVAALNATRRADGGPAVSSGSASGAAHSEVYPHALPWEKTQLPAGGGGDDDVTSNGAGLDPWEVTMARRALEQFPPPPPPPPPPSSSSRARPSTASAGAGEAEGMAVFLIIVKHMPGGQPAKPDHEGMKEEAGPASPCVVRVFVPRDQLTKVTVTHLKWELQRQLGVPATYQDLRTEGVRLLDELPLELLDPRMVLFADFSAAPVEVVEAERQRQRQRQRQRHQQQQQEKRPRHGAPHERQSVVEEEQGEFLEQKHDGAAAEGMARRSTETIFRRDPASVHTRPNTSHADGAAVSPPSSPTTTAAAPHAEDAVTAHLRRLRGLLRSEDGEQLLSPPQRRAPPPPPAIPSELGKPASSRSSSSSLSSSSSPSTSASSLDSVSASPASRWKDSTARRGASSPAARHVPHDASSSRRGRDGSGGHSTAVRPSPFDGSALGTDVWDPFDPVPYSRAHFTSLSAPAAAHASGRAPRQSSTERGERASPPLPSSSRGGEERGVDGSRQCRERRGTEERHAGAEKDDTVLIGSVVRPFHLKAVPMHASGTQQQRGPESGLATPHASALALSSPKQTTVAAAAALPVPPLKYYHPSRLGIHAPLPPPSTASSASASLPTASSLAEAAVPATGTCVNHVDNVYPDALVAYPARTVPRSTTPGLALAAALAGFAHGGSGLPLNGAAAPPTRASTPPTRSRALGALHRDLSPTSRALAAAAASASAQSRERMRQALALKTAQEALSLAASVRGREGPNRIGAGGGGDGRAGGDAAHPPATSWQAFAKPFSLGRAQHSRQGIPVDVSRFPVPEEGGVSPSEFSNRERSAQSPPLVDDDEDGSVHCGAKGNECGSPRKVLTGISRVEPAVVDELLSRSESL